MHFETAIAIFFTIAFSMIIFFFIRSKKFLSSH